MTELQVLYRGADELARHLADFRAQGALLLPMATPPPGIEQYGELALRIQLPGAEIETRAQVVQVIEGLGIAARLLDPADAEALCAGIPPAEAPAQPRVAAGPAPPPGRSGQAPAAAEETAPATQPPRAEGIPRGSSPLSWPIEKLQSEWHTLTMADKVRLAKHGKRPARALIMRSQDQQLHSCLLSNNKISPDEVALLASKANLHPDLLKRIATSQEWLRHSAIVRNLVCNPKTTTPQLTKLVNHLPADELRRLTRTGKVRAAAKQLIIRKLEQREGRRR